MLNIGKIVTVTNRGAINGGSGSVSFSATAVGGAGVSNAGTIMTLTNSGAITGGAGSAASGFGFISKATGGDGVITPARSRR